MQEITGYIESHWDLGMYPCQTAICVSNKN